MREPARRHEVKIAPAPLPSNPQVRVLLEDFGPDASESNGAITVLDLQNTDSEMKAFIGGIALGGYGYYCPYVHNKMAKVDLSDFSTVTTISLDSRGYSAIIADPARGALYLVRSYFTYSTERPTAIPCIGCSRSATKLRVNQLALKHHATSRRRLDLPPLASGAILQRGRPLRHRRARRRGVSIEELHRSHVDLEQSEGIPWDLRGWREQQVRGSARACRRACMRPRVSILHVSRI